MTPLNDKAYFFLKWTATVFFPLFITLLASVWGALAGYGILHAELGILIVAILGFINTFLGGLVGASTSAYNKQQELAARQQELSARQQESLVGQQNSPAGQQELSARQQESPARQLDASGQKPDIEDGAYTPKRLKEV